MIKGGIKTAALFAAAVFFVLVDRLLKAWARESRPVIEMFGDLFRFSFSKNSGIAFSLPLNEVLASILIGVVIAGLVGYFIFLLQKTAPFEAGFVLMAILGAGSNLFDRLKYGFVIDYFDLRFYSVFNLADAMIIVGLLGLLLSRRARGLTKIE